jgi:crotonobetainyl-CoA:carnitine CoA-transferase CaiB-like acyl-CoA transferase
MGAEVIKVERPGMGDDTRAAGPPFLHDRDGRETDESAYYLSANRNKRSITVDIRTRRGQEIIRRLAEKSDVVIENYVVGGLARYGLDYPSLRAANPSMVYCSITGFGQDGPYAQRPGYDFIFQGMGGLMSITGERDDCPGGGPQKVGVAFADIMTGMYAATAVLGALVHARRTGEGQHIDLALLDVVVAALANMNSYYLVSGEVPARYGNAHANLVPYGVFQTADGPMILAVGNDSQFRSLCDVLGTTWAADERFASNPARIRNRDLIVPMVAAELADHRRAELIDRLLAAHVSAGPINDIAEVFTDPQVQHRQMRLDLPHPLSGTVPLVASPIRYSETPIEYRSAPPLLGEHTDAVLADLLGYDRSTIDDLHAEGVL